MDDGLAVKTGRDLTSVAKGSSEPLFLDCSAFARLSALAASCVRS